MTKSARRIRSRYATVLAVMLVLLSFLAGCKGDDGAAGPAGQSGRDAVNAVDISTMSTEALAALSMTGQITSVTIASPPLVRFTITDAAGRGITGLGTATAGSLDYMRFGLSKLVPGTAGNPDKWVTYTGLTSATSRPSTERNGAMVDNGDGSYTYTFTTNVSTSPANAWETVYEASLTHRLAIQISATNNPFPPANITHDFVPAGGAVTSRRDIVEKSSCMECHGKFRNFHGDARQDPKYCVVCHTDQRRIGRTASAPTSTGLLSGSTYVVNGEAQGNFPVMIHKIHKGNRLTLKGYNYAGVAFNEIGYPQDQKNCRKCHQASADAPQGDNWKNKPSRIACGGCHDNISFEAELPAGFVAHSGGAFADDTGCTVCHPATGAKTPTNGPIETVHLTAYVTTNNPTVPAGAANFTYEISAVTTTSLIVGSTTNTLPVVTFGIRQDGLYMNLTGTALPAGISSGPSFLVAYAAPQDGVTGPADWNQRGKAAAQPATVSLANIRSGSQGSMTDNGSGTYTAVLRGTLSGEVYPAAFSATATMRAVGLQGAFSQTEASLIPPRDMNNDGDTLDTFGRNTKSVIKGVTNDPARRVVVDNDKCLACHETLQLHGGSRVDEMAICVTCHNPNLTSSGRGADPATVLARLNIADAANGNPAGTSAAALTANGYDPANPLTYPEASNNFKDMIHGIHASHDRTTRYDFVRDRTTSGVFYYDWSHVTFPGVLSNCETCHLAGTYDVDLPAGVFMSNSYMATGATTSAQVAAARASVPNSTDKVDTPIASTCVACHDSVVAKAHITQNGAYLSSDRSAATGAVELCTLCHGPGRTSDVVTRHPK